MATNNIPALLKNPPFAPVQVTVTATATSLQSLLGESGPVANYGGIQVKNLSTNTNSVFWSNVNTVTTSNGDEIPAGTAQVIPPAVCSNTGTVYLVASGNTNVGIVLLAG
jgi:hypothetical protein